MVLAGQLDVSAAGGTVRATGVRGDESSLMAGGAFA
jgi:hypothetical protein